MFYNNAGSNGGNIFKFSGKLIRDEKRLFSSNKVEIYLNYGGNYLELLRKFGLKFKNFYIMVSKSCVRRRLAPNYVLTFQSL